MVRTSLLQILCNLTGCIYTFGNGSGGNGRSADGIDHNPIRTVFIYDKIAFPAITSFDILVYKITVFCFHSQSCGFCNG